MRGDHVSRPIEELVASAEHLVRNGVKELMLIAQELTYYGLDIYKKRALPKLLDALCAVEGLQWIRLHYAYPSKFPRDIFDVMAAQPKICNYLDIPLQHASDAVLERMRRQITRKDTEELIAYARKTVPGIAIRTTFLVGHPGETEEEFQELCEFVQAMRFERLGVFQLQPRRRYHCPRLPRRRPCGSQSRPGQPPDGHPAGDQPGVERRTRW